MNFIHTADLHLGYRQYDLDERFRDFGRSFKTIAQHAIEARAEFVLIAGDLFHSRNINAPTYFQAHHILTMLKDAGIPCIAIEGNHDRAFVRDGMSWLEALESQGLLKLIKPSPEGLVDDFVDIGGTRIFGMCYAGASTSRIIPDIARRIAEINSTDKPNYTVLMMHTGIEGQMKGNIIGETSYEDIYKLKDVVDYLALGHYHCAYELDSWVFNPGSPDTCSIAEVGEPKGYYHVVDGKATLKEIPRRKFLPITIRTDDHLNAASLMAEVEKRLATIGKLDQQPVVHILFRGCLNFDKAHLDLDSVKAIATEKLDPLYVDARFDLTNDEVGISGIEAGNFDRLAIEREVLSRLASTDSMLAPYAGYFACVLSEIKDLAIREADPQTLDRTLRRAFEDIRAGKAPISARPAAEEKKPVSAPGVEASTRTVEEKPPTPKKKARQKHVETKVEAPPAPLVQSRTLDQFWSGGKTP
ncbi:metallophosphoesterase family protein [Methanocella arvoryzae]|uniref:Predicted DNA repair exonuclease (Rad32/Mre11-like) n=1 Tax=Methanocella arvoryzae (strain DSM 22066 / NBRC 105507 / MRE50) TaxID=351160 RepID=Q0W176_METAR|nr:exonuclease SbcCD subunit D [Methanocella arvoryzae]CAJ37867.1 predicted DNA repair exonuclease (Rad32/Mre11-like) [Methanocella arvoryzae MRE50]